MVSYLFSTSGCVGRAGWWLFQLLFILYFIGLVVWFVALGAGEGESFQQASQRYSHVTPQGSVEFGRAAGEQHPGQMLILSLTLLLAIWSSFAVEIKRWHDRGMSGFFVLLRFVPSFSYYYWKLNPGNANAVLAYSLLAAGIWLFQLVQLGFLPSMEDHIVQTPPRSGRFAAAGFQPVPPARSAPPKHSRAGTFLFGFFCALLLIGALAGAYLLGRGILPHASFKPLHAIINLARNAVPAFQPSASPLDTNALSAVPSAPAASPSAGPVVFPPPSAHSGGVSDDIFKREHIKDDNLVDTYAKDWVIVNGEKLSGVSSVLAAPNYQVTIMYADGGKNVPASSLPSGFLKAWDVTQFSLEEANKPPDKQ